MLASHWHWLISQPLILFSVFAFLGLFWDLSVYSRSLSKALTCSILTFALLYQGHTCHLICVSAHACVCVCVRVFQAESFAKITWLLSFCLCPPHFRISIFSLVVATSLCHDTRQGCLSANILHYISPSLLFLPSRYLYSFYLIFPAFLAPSSTHTQLSPALLPATKRLYTQLKLIANWKSKHHPSQTCHLV